MSGDPVGLVTGGGRGIGLAIVRAWAARGVVPVVVDSDPDAGLAVTRALAGAAGPHAVHVADVRDFARAHAVVDAVVEKFGRLDYVVANAGITRDRVSWKMSEQEWDDVIAVDLKGAFNYAHAAIPHLRARREGRLVFVSSINGMRGKFGQCNYSAAKAGLIGLARSLALELGEAGITVNVVAPGFVATGMTEALPEVAARAAAESALRRTAQPDDIAAMVDALCRPEARHVTGVVMRVDGGQALAAALA